MNTATKVITVSVTNINDVPPVISSAATYSAAENQTGIGNVTYSDADGGTFSFSLTGTDASLINISSSGVLTFKAAPDYETKTSYSFTVVVSDGVNATSKSITISISDVSESIPGYKLPKAIKVIETS